MLFLVLSKRYTLCERNREINIQAIVEEHYERYMDQEEEYMRENQFMVHSILIVGSALCSSSFWFDSHVHSQICYWFFPNSSITFSVAAFCGSSFLLCLDFYTKFSTSRQKWFRRGKGMKVLNFKI